ncbi:MAG: hypothetical protein QOI81_2239, partial [Actinomycetota bacterium]|nr:hypothetical protein [Actinomycetota bacterium]
MQTVRSKMLRAIAAAALLAGSLVSIPARASGVAPPDPVPMLSPRVMAWGLRAAGTVVRRPPGITVTQVAVPAKIRGSAAGAPASVYRVTVAGRYPPRALRYIVSADGTPIAYGVPAPRGRALRAVTTDPAVLTARLTARYEGSPPAAAAVTGPAALPTVAQASSLPILPGSNSRGPLSVTREVYDFGTRAFQPTQLVGKVELTADVHYPTGLPAGPYPLVLFLHGNHFSCYRGDRVAYQWPCKRGWAPLPNYTGYDYIAQRLASFGFIVVSISGNGVNVLGNQVDDTGMRQRGELIEKHIDLWKTWATVGGAPFGDRFIGKVDFSRIGTMGHSRGGEGAVWNVIVDREQPSPYGIDALLPLAPVDFDRQTVNGVPMAVMLPYCDGDVSDLEGMHFFDDARYRQPGDPAPKYTVTVYGANHDFFNTVWTPGGQYPGGYDDTVGGCAGALTPQKERAAGKAYVVSFFRLQLAGRSSLDPIWTGEAQPSSLPANQALVSYLPPDTPGERRDLDRFSAPGSLSVDALGGAVRAQFMSSYGWCADDYSNPCVPGRDAYRDVHLPGLGQAVFGWSSRQAVVSLQIPAASQDVSGFDALQFRAALNPGYTANRRVDLQDLNVVLTDSAGNRATVSASSVGNQALAAPSGPSGHMILNQVRF